MTAVHCCGNHKEQYCCTYQEKLKEDPLYKSKWVEMYDDDHSNPKDNSILLTVLAFVVPLLFLLCIGLSVCIFCSQKKRIYQLVSKE